MAAVRQYLTLKYERGREFARRNTEYTIGWGEGDWLRGAKEEAESDERGGE
jgi:hypothetical protein